MITHRILIAISVLSLAGAGGALLAPDHAQEQGPQATKEHALLKMDEGRWNADITIYPGPGSPAQKDKGVEENKLDFNGLWLTTDVRTDGGFKGHGVTGYDPARKVYVGVWVDNMSTSLITSEASFDASAKTFTAKGQAPDMATGKLRPFRSVVRYPDADTRHLESWMAGDDGKEMKTLEIRYTRAQ